MSDTGKLLVVVGPSGVGKGTVIRQALEQDPTR
jgi:guanylate kinase